MATARAWVLNFDAEDELARPAGHTPSRAVLARSRALAERVGPLLAPGDTVLTTGDVVPAGAWEGRAWCPTPAALRALARAGASLPPAPALEILRRGNHRRFSAALGQTLPGARYIEEWSELVSAITGPSPTDCWLLKRPFGFAGRGRRKVRRGAIEAAARPWIEASLAAGEGLQAEPWVERDGDFALHGFLAATGELSLGEPTAQTVDATGAWLATARAGEDTLAEGERRALREAAAGAGAALREAGYFGPFGVDAFRWLDRDGARRFNARSEINARYSMGWAVGMGSLRPDLAE